MKKDTEYLDCLSFYQWTQYQYKLKGLVIKHVNEGKRSKVGGMFLKMIGLTKGLPDYQILLSNKNWHGLFIEMKTKKEKDKKMRSEQIEFIGKLIKNGYYGTFAYGWEEAVKIVNEYMDDKI